MLQAVRMRVGHLFSGSRYLTPFEYPFIYMIKKAEESAENGHALLENFFAPEYILWLRIPPKVPISPLQKQRLMELIEERDHFGIREFMKGLNN